jgi:hypothetical protein
MLMTRFPLSSDFEKSVVFLMTESVISQIFNNSVIFDRSVQIALNVRASSSQFPNEATETMIFGMELWAFLCIIGGVVLVIAIVTVVIVRRRCHSEYVYTTESDNCEEVDPTAAFIAEQRREVIQSASCDYANPLADEEEFQTLAGDEPMTDADQDDTFDNRNVDEML